MAATRHRYAWRGAAGEATAAARCTALTRAVADVPRLTAAGDGAKPPPPAAAALDARVCGTRFCWGCGEAPHVPVACAPWRRFRTRVAREEVRARQAKAALDAMSGKPSAASAKARLLPGGGKAGDGADGADSFDAADAARAEAAQLSNALWILGNTKASRELAHLSQPPSALLL